MKINLICPINKLSYGYVSINILKELMKEHEVSLFNLNQLQDDDVEDYDKMIIHKALDNRKNADTDAPTLIVWHHFDLINKKPKGWNGKFIAFPIFETSSFHPEEVKHIESVDGIIVTSEWYKKVIENHSKIPCKVAQLGVDQELFKRDLKLENSLRKTKETRFLVAGKWEIRKSHQEILECFNKSFGKNSPVKLTMLCHNIFLGDRENKKWENFAKSGRMGHKVQVLTRAPSHKDIYNLMNHHHFGILPSKAEGWNLELHEMMTLAKPCITTNYSAHTEYCNKDNSYLVDITEEEPCYDGTFFMGHGKWAKIGEQQKDQICTYLQELHKKRLDEFVFPDINRSVEHLTWNNTANKIVEFINGL